MTNLEKHKADLTRLIAQAAELESDLLAKLQEEAGKSTPTARSGKRKPSAPKDPQPGFKFQLEYQRWYTEAQQVIRQLLPSRLAEFDSLYEADRRRKDFNRATYTISDWLLGTRSAQDPLRGGKFFDDNGVAFTKFQMQCLILVAAQARFDSSLFDIRQLAQADIFESELDAATELLKKGFLRGAGAVAGVVIERHLGQAAAARSIKLRKKEPSIGDLNDALKEADAIDTPMWRFIQRTGDLRNLCDHNKQREPTSDEVQELINGAERIIKTVF